MHAFSEPMPLLTVCKPENDAEAVALQAVLNEHGIFSEVFSFHDTAYDGLYQSQYGWGVLKVREEDHGEARQIIDNWRNAAPTDPPWDREDR